MEVNGKLHTLAALPPAKETPVPIGAWADSDPAWPLRRSEKSLALEGN
jgi:hypothetical protein